MEVQARHHWERHKVAPVSVQGRGIHAGGHGLLRKDCEVARIGVLPTPRVLALPVGILHADQEPPLIPGKIGVPCVALH